MYTYLDIYTCQNLFLYNYIYKIDINIHIHIRASIYATNLFQTPNSEFMVFVNPRVLLDPALRSLPNGIEANLKQMEAAQNMMYYPSIHHLDLRCG